METVSLSFDKFQKSQLPTAASDSNDDSHTQPNPFAGVAGGASGSTLKPHQLIVFSSTAADQFAFCEGLGDDKSDPLDPSGPAVSWLVLNDDRFGFCDGLDPYDGSGGSVVGDARQAQVRSDNDVPWGRYNTEPEETFMSSSLDFSFLGDDLL